MKVVIDITHPANVNFFKNAIQCLKIKHDIDTFLIAQNRGNLISILERECQGIPSTCIGKYKMSLWSKAVGLAERSLKMSFYIYKRDFDVATSFDDLGLCYSTFLLRKPLIIFEDDIEKRFGFYRYRAFPKWIVMPRHIPVTGNNVLKYDGFKELAYLHPNYFKPNRDTLKQYGLHAQNYVFIREVINTTVDYTHLNMGKLSEVCSYLREVGFEVIASLEDKSLRKDFEDNCIILKEPVDDIYSLLHFARLTISSGDTMARESCMVGTPAIYTGEREMSINKELESKGVFFKRDSKEEIFTCIKNIVNENAKKETEKMMADAIKNEWEDTTEVIVNTLLSVIYNDNSLIEKYSFKRGIK